MSVTSFAKGSNMVFSLRRSAVLAMVPSQRTIRSFHFTAPSLQTAFLPWTQLDNDTKRKFINDFVELYKEKNGRTKNYYKQLAQGMDDYDDIPAVFGILYKDLVEKQEVGASTAEFPEDFFGLLVKK